METNEQVIQAQLAATTAPYEAQLSNLRAEYDASREKQARENAKRLNELYIMSEQNKRTLPQQLAVQGMNGGLTESSMVNLANTYMNNRNAQNQAYQDNLADLTLAYNQNVNDINAKIAAARAQADAELAALAASRRSGSGGSSGGWSGGTNNDQIKNLIGNTSDALLNSIPTLGNPLTTFWNTQNGPREQKNTVVNNGWSAMENGGDQEKAKRSWNALKGL